MSSIKREINAFLRRSLAQAAEKWTIKKSVLNVQICCFANETYCFFDVFIAVAVVVAKAPYFLSVTEMTV